MLSTHRRLVERFLTAVAVILVLSGSPGASAQDKAQAKDPKQAADLLINDLKMRGQSLRELQEKEAQAQGEREAIYRNELLRRWERYSARLDELVKNIQAQREAGLDPGEQLTAAQELTVAVAKGLGDAALTREAQLITLEDRHAEATGDEKLTLERQVRRDSVLYRTVLQAIVDNIERMKLLGLDETVHGEQADSLLRERAQILEGRLRLLVEERADVKDRQRRAIEADKPALAKEQNEVAGRLSFWADGLRKVLDQMERRGLDTTEPREFLVKATGEVAPGTLDTKVAVGLLQQSIIDGRRWLKEKGPQLLVRLAVVLLILLVFWFVAKMVGRGVGAFVRSSRLEFSKLLQDFFVTVAARLVLVLGVIVALSQLGLDLAPLLAGLGIAGFIVGFALQDTLSNFAAGLMILVYRPYDVGDAVEVAGVLGVVSEMSLVSTTIKTFDNQKLIVPNSKIWGNVIRNLTAEKTRRVDLVFGISYGDDIVKAERILREEVEKHELVLADPEPVIRVSALADSSVNFIVRPWAKTPDYWAVYWDLTKNVKLRFDEEGITIPFPQRDVHLIKEE
jgi:small conductance mechanosensitive channel